MSEMLTDSSQGGRVDERGGDIKIALPGTWWNVPMDDSESAARTIRAIVDEVIGRADDRATLRNAIREELMSDVNAARSRGAHALYLARELTRGIPLSASLTVLWPRVSDVPADIAEEPWLHRAVLKLAVDASRKDGDTGDGTEQDPSLDADLDIPGMAMLRRVARHTTLTASGQPSVALQVDYWIAFAGHARPALISFSSVFSGMDEQLVGLFDAIAATTTWQDDLEGT